MALAAVILGVLGLSPSLRWIPEVPLLAALVLVPAAILGLTGARVGRRAGTVRAGAFAVWEPDRRRAGWEGLRAVGDSLPLALAQPTFI